VSLKELKNGLLSETLRKEFKEELLVKIHKDIEDKLARC
jgi:hypothetical protein